VAFWEEPITYLKGVGPKRAALLASELGIHTFDDLLHYYPRRYVDKSVVSRIAALRSDADVAVSLVGRLGPFELSTGKGRKVLRSQLIDDSGSVDLNWFQGITWIQQRYKPGDWVTLYGKPSWFSSRAQFTHPELEKIQAEEHGLEGLRIVPIYPTTDKLARAGLDARGLRRLVLNLLETGRDVIPEVLSSQLVRAEGLLARAQALSNIHFPESMALLAQAQWRLKFEELFFFELVLARRKQLSQLLRPSPPFQHIGDYFNRFYQECLPFELTGAQKRVLREIRQDVARGYQMNRLVQGDVGSGKTIVALMTLLMALDNGYQGALMAPTEILAEQHSQNLRRLIQPLGIQLDLLTGNVKGAARKRILADLKTGATQLLVGTHALIEDTVQFRALGLTIIDEQHKFGVMQRARFWKKLPGRYPHNLMLTATPIPRTLALTSYGEVDVSVIDELPPGRKPIKTLLQTQAQRLKVFGFLRRQLEAGSQVYVVYPLVAESEKSDLLAVESGYEALQRSFPERRIGIVHGRMASEAKEFEMQRFKQQQTHILVATTVIEVGVDIPSATVMVIENAERFGLSQLHQLRGRVGRGGEQSYCILMGSPKLSKDASKRLQVMVESNDGFYIAEKDLELRGPGDFLGTKQSGLPEFKLADITQDGPCLEAARNAAFALIAEDPELALPEHSAISAYARQYQQRHNLDLVVA
jgi:ATP-dependent DNA helicase RecG